MAGVAPPTGGAGIGPGKGGGKAAAPKPSSTNRGATAKAPASPSVLNPLNQNQITKYATQAVAKAYAPVYADITAQQKQAQGISDKRTADNQYYQGWINTQMQQMQAQNDAFDSHLQGLESQINSTQNGLYAAQPGQLTSEANARAGNVSNNAMSNDFGTSPSAGGMTQLAQNQAANMALLTSTEQATNSQMGTNHDLENAARLNDTAFVAGLQDKQLSDLQSTLLKLGSIRSTDLSKQGSETANLEDKLYAQNVTLAENNRNYNTAVAKLGVSEANTGSLIQQRSANEKLNQQKYNLSLTKQQQSQMNSDRTYQLNVDKYNHSVAKDLYEREHSLGPYKKSTTTGGMKPLSTTSQNVLRQQIQKETGTYSAIIANGHNAQGQPINAQQATQLINNGGIYYVKGTDASGKSAVWKPVHVVAMGPNNPIALAGLELALVGSGGSQGISKYVVQQLNNMGLTNLGGLQLAPN